jgi:4-amino-4-deoxy-L-arabinose transferase-like glycosyltransferase
MMAAAIFDGRVFTVRTALLLAAALRLSIATLAWQLGGPDAFLASDSSGYLASAAALAASFEFDDVLGRPEIFRTPGYPFLLTPGVLLGSPLPYALLVQIALSLCVVLLTHATARRLLNDDRAAGVCALVVAIEPTMLLWSMKVMPETLFTVLVLAFACAALRAIGTAGARWTALAAAALASAAYVKPIAYPLVFLSFGALVVLQHRRKIRSYRPAVAFLVVSAGLLAPWHIRNARVAGYAGFSTLFDHALYVSVGGSLAAQRDGRSFERVRIERLARTPRLAAETSYSEMRTEGLTLLRTHAAEYGRIHLYGVMRTLFDPGAVEYLRLLGAYPKTGGALVRMIDRGPVAGLRDFGARQPLAFWTSAVMSAVLLPLVMLPVVAARGVPAPARSAYLFLGLVAAYFVICGGGVPGSSRFRVPVVPLLVLMTGFAVNARAASDAVAIAAGRR